MTKSKLKFEGRPDGLPMGYFLQNKYFLYAILGEKFFVSKVGDQWVRFFPDKIFNIEFIIDVNWVKRYKLGEVWFLSDNWNYIGVWPTNLEGVPSEETYYILGDKNDILLADGYLLTYE